MPIERLSLPDGVRVPLDPEVINQVVGRIATIYVRRFVTLEAGEYNLTPEVWKHNQYTHHLTVHDNDTATYRMFPVDEGAGFLDSDQVERGFISGGQMRKIPQETPMAVVLGGASDGNLRLFELILYTQ
jgi:hypothetical protein